MTTHTQSQRQQEADENFKFFQKKLPALIKKHEGEFALLKDQKVINFFETSSKAMQYAKKHITDDMFSIQEVTDEVVDLGIISYGLS